MIALNCEFVSAFDWAVIRLATYLPGSASQARLLFGSVSLLTKDRPRPIGSLKPESHKIGKGKCGKVFFKRIVLRAQDAVEWYRSAGSSGIITPIPAEPSEVDEKNDGIALSPTSFEDDPPWPSLGVPLGIDLYSNAGGPGDPAPFRGPGSPRIHRRFGDGAGFEAVLADKLAISFLKRRIHLDLTDYTEYLGGLALIVPDPVLRRVQHILVPNQGTYGPERLVYRLIPRPGQNLNQLKLTILERRSNLLSRFELVTVPADGLITVQSNLPFDKTGYAISHDVQGVIAYQQPLPFVRSVQISLGVAGRKVRVQAPRTESPRSPVETYEITEYAQEIPIGVGEERRNAIAKVAEAEQRRIRRAAAKQYQQTWFDSGSRKKALLFIRSLLARARFSVMVADPYFGANQILQFLQAVPRTQIDFTILTSRLAFEGWHGGFGNASQDDQQETDHIRNNESEVNPLLLFAYSLETLRSRGMKSVAALVLSGKTPPLHDRFLVIDDEVLFLGNSLNTLGERSSLILSVPDSEPILSRIRAMASLAIPFEHYASQYYQAPPPPQEGS